MALWERVFAAMYEPVVMARTERGGLAAMRGELLRGVSGPTLELGAGTGLNLEHYPPEGVDLTLAEPAEPMAKRLEQRVRTIRPSARVVRTPAESLPFESASFDTVVSTLVLCTVRDVPKTLAEVRRVLRPTGRLLFLEHVRSDDPGLVRWQDRIQPLWFRIACGCNCNRPTLSSIESAGFEVERLEMGLLPKSVPITRPIITGSAHPRRDAPVEV